MAKTPQSKGKGKRLRSSLNEVATAVNSKKRLFLEAVSSVAVDNPKYLGPGLTHAPPPVGEEAGPSGKAGGGTPPPPPVEGVAKEPGVGDLPFTKVTRKKRKKKGKGPPDPQNGAPGPLVIQGAPQKAGPKGNNPRQPPPKGRTTGSKPDYREGGHPPLWC